MRPRVLVAGVGNVFLGDDAFGVEVVGRLAREQLPKGVRVADYGVRGVHLAYDLLDGCDALVMVDALPTGGPPGTLAVIDASEGTEGSARPLDGHGMTPATVLETLSHLGGSVPRVLVVGCEPDSLEEGMGLSPAVEAVLDEAVALCRRVVDGLLDQPRSGREEDSPQGPQPQAGAGEPAGSDRNLSGGQRWPEETKETTPW